jgi:hypothetical protein
MPRKRELLSGLHSCLKDSIVFRLSQCLYAIRQHVGLVGNVLSDNLYPIPHNK